MAEKFDPYRKWLGIPPEEQPPNCYRLLGIGLFESDLDVISNAADRQMAHVRTFQSGRFGNVSQTILNELSAARLLLLNPERKAAYDEQLRRELASRPALPPARPVIEEDGSSGIALPFSTEPEVVAELETGAFSMPSESTGPEMAVEIPGLGADEEAAEFESRLLSAPPPASTPPAVAEDFVSPTPQLVSAGPVLSSGTHTPRKRSKTIGVGIVLAAVVGAALLAALTWIWTHGGSRPEPPPRKGAPPVHRTAPGSPGRSSGGTKGPNVH